MKNTLLILVLFLTNFTLVAQQADTTLIKKHLTKITKTDKPRNYKNTETLNEVAAYIYSEFEKYADTTYYQPYSYKNAEYKNVVCVLGSEHEKTIVIGAHYDVAGDQEGADDNATGVVGLLELIRMLDGKPLNYRLEIVAYTLEEPPFFRTKLMGSKIHAMSLEKNNVDVYGMICLEMIGYFDDNKGSQKYPLGLLSLFYGRTGDYITLVNRMNKGKFAKKFNKQYKEKGLIRTKIFTGPAKLTGVDWSDHLNYWDLGISAIMITDTSFYRNKNYHEETDTMDTLDFYRMGKVIDNLYETILHFQ